MKKVIIITSRKEDYDLENLTKWITEVGATYEVFISPKNFWEIFRKEAGPETYFIFEFYGNGNGYVGQELDNGLHAMAYTKSAVFGCGCGDSYNSHNARINTKEKFGAFIADKMATDGFNRWL